jgi:signal transduction histidine kinase
VGHEAEGDTRRQDVAGTGHAKRDQTDESLRVERDKTDAGVAEKLEAVEDQADEVLRIARERADRVVQTARDAADRRPQSPSGEASAERERSRADVVLERERSTADAVLEGQRARRSRYLADFLASEREATDQDLIDERAHDDKLIAARDEVLGIVSHDLRSLLGGLSLNVEVLIRQAPQGAPGDKMRSIAATSKRLVARMNRLVNDLLDIVSIEAGGLAVLPEQVEVTTILSETLEAFAPIAAAKSITLGGDTAAPPLHARLDGERVLQVLANLVSNAIKFTAAGGHVSIRISNDGNEIRFAVSDTGIGISEDVLPRVFERFHQVSKDRRGVGLGLHISKCIVEAHGGRMWAESTLGTGSTFYFALPVSVVAH